MLVAAPLGPETTAPIVQLERGVHDQGQAQAETSTTGEESLTRIRFEDTMYWCPHRVRLHYQFEGKVWSCWARELGAVCVGEGETPRFAREDWYQGFHAVFQRLFAIRPFEMTADDARCWETILSVVDVVEYRQNKVLSVREIGCVRFRRTPYPSQMQWIDGRKEAFSLHQVPAELAGCKPGQWVEAIVEREPVTGRLLKVVHVQRIRSPLPESPRSVRSAWDAMRAAELPEGEWDWPDKNKMPGASEDAR